MKAKEKAKRSVEHVYLLAVYLTLLSSKLQLSIATRTKKHDPTYYLTVTTSDSSTSRELSCPFTTWFTADGYFVPQPFQQWLANNIDVIGQADQKNSAKAEKEDSLVSEVEVNGSASTTGATPQQGKANKKSKRKG